ncbi:MAG TPA: DUF4259 domain-containing protein [Pseudonocardiaceae bacterium]
MGAWGADPFDNDEAADWRYLLLDGGGPEVVATALADPCDDAGAAARAVAAAAVVGASVGVGITVPRDMTDWLDRQETSALAALAPDAAAALDRVLAGSELRELWDESGVDDWHTAVQRLHDDLAAAIGG